MPDRKPQDLKMNGELRFHGEHRICHSCGLSKYYGGTHRHTCSCCGSPTTSLNHTEKRHQ